jgi:hypothetical protein
LRFRPAIAATADFKLDNVTFQEFEPPLDPRVVHEKIILALAADEAIALIGTVKFYFALHRAALNLDASNRAITSASRA